MPGDQEKLFRVAKKYGATDIKDLNAFNKQMNNPLYREQVFTKVKSKGLYDGDLDSFSSKYGYGGKDPIKASVDTKPKSSVKVDMSKGFGDVGALKAGEYEVGTKGTDAISNTGAKAVKQEKVNLIEYNKIRQEQSKEEGYYAMKAQKEQTGSFTFNPIPVLEGKDKILANMKSPMEIYQGWMSDRGDQASKKRFELELGAVGQQRENLGNAIEYLSDEIEKKIGTNTFEYLGDMQVKIKDAYAEVDKFAQEVEKAGRVNTYNGKKIFTKTEDLKKYKELVSQAEALQNEVKPFFNDPLIQEFTELSGAYRYNNALFQSVLADPKNQDAQDFNRVIEERQKEVDEAYKNGSTIGNIARSGFSIFSNLAATTFAAIPQMGSVLSDINKPDEMTSLNFLGEFASGIVRDMAGMAGTVSTHDQREFSTLTAKDVMGEYQVDFDTQGSIVRVLDKKGFKATDAETEAVTNYIKEHPELKIESKNNWDVLPYLAGQMSAEVLAQAMGTKGIGKAAISLGAANKLAGKIGTISMITAQTVPKAYERAIAAGLNRRESGAYAYLFGLGIGAIGTIGNLEAKWGGIDDASSNINPFSKTGIRSTTGTMTGRDLAAIHVGNVSKDIFKESVIEEGLVEPLYQFGLESIYNGYTGKKNFTPEEQFTWENIKSNVVVTIAATLLPGSLSSRTNEVTNHSLNTAFENFDLYKDKVRQMAQLGQLNLRGKEPDKFVDEHIAEIEQAKNIADLFDTTENRSDIAGLAWEKSKLLNQKSKLYDLKDKERIQRKIDFIDLQLSKYENTGKKTDEESDTGDSASAESETAATRQAYEGGVEPTPPTEGTEIPFDPEPTETPDAVPTEPIERPDEFEKKAKDASMDEELALKLEGKNEEERKAVLQEYYNTKPSENSAKTQAIKDKLRAGYSPEQADASMALLEAKAFKWAADNDKTVDEFYDQFDKVEYKKGNRIIIRDKEGIVGIGEVQEVSKDKKFVRTDLSDKFVPIEETELVDPSVKEEIPREFSPSNKGEFTSSKGLVVKEIDGEIVTLKDGVETKKGRKQAFREYAQRFDFTEGDEAELNENIREDKINSHIAENSNNPSELAKVFLEEEPVGEMLSEKERVIAENGIFTTKESFAEFDDKNNLDPKMQGYFKSKKGLKNFPLDVIAQEMSPEPGESGVEITPQDLVDFMNKFPDPRAALTQGESEAKTIARERFKELTGLDLDDEIAMEAVNQRVEKLSQIEKDLLDAEYESRAELEAAYERAYAETDGFTKETDPVGVAPEVSKEARKINNALNAPDFETLVEELMPVFESTLTEDEKVTFRSDSEQGIDSPLTDQFKSFVKSAADGKVSPEVQAEMDAVMAIPGEKFAEKFEELNKAPTVPEEKIEEVKDISVYKKVKEIFKNIFGLKDKQAKAAAKLADKILGTIAERAGVSKEDASILINWQKATEEDIKRLTDAGREVYFQLKGEVDDSKDKKIMVNGEEKTVRPISFDVVNGFYSPIEKQLSEMKADKLPAKQWADKLKSEEAKWTGLTEWLNSQEGSISKADIQKWMKENRIEIVEVVKGLEEKKLTDDEINEAIYTSSKEWIDLGSGVKVKSFNSSNVRISINGVEEVINFIEAENKIHKALNTGNKDTKFHKYQLEGEKENYKEILVTLPFISPKTSKLPDGYKLIPKGEYENASKWTPDFVIVGSDGLSISGGDNEAEALSNFLSTHAPVSDNIKKFKSGHWDEPNILVHLRMNTRTSSDGKKVLFLEEIQSDWGQEGKRRGFRNTPGNAKETAIYLISKNVYNIRNRAALGSITSEEANTFLAAAKKDSESKGLTQADIEYGLNKYGDFTSTQEKGTEQAPFVTDTNQWVKLGLKVALKEAVKQGADKIAWTTGDQQNERYDLSKQVKFIDYSKNSDGTYDIGADIEGTGYNDVDLKQIESIFGKEIAEKVQSGVGIESPINATQKRLEGLDLKIQGKGMIGFYGNKDSKGIIGGVAEKLFGQKVGSTEINSVKREPSDIDFENPPTVVKLPNGQYGMFTPFPVEENPIFDSLEDAKKALKSENERFADALKAYQEGVKDTVFSQPSVEITPELKSQVNQGLPLFQQDGEVHGAVEFLNDMAAIIYAVTNPNVSTPLHELTHVYEKYLTDAEKTEVENWSGEKSGTRGFSEAFARGFERYLYDGVSPNTEMTAIFDKFRKWMHEIYQTVVGQKLNRQMQNIYANMLGVPEHIVGIPNPVGGTKEYTKEMFEAMGRDPLVKKMSRAWDKVWEEAMNNVKSGLVDPAQVVLDIITGGAMPAADLTQAYILIDRARISAQMELNKLAFEEAQNEPDPDKSNFMYVQAMERMAQLEEDIQKNGMAGDRLGTGAGQLLNFMKVFADRDYSLVSVLWQARKMKPRKVNGTVTYDKLTEEETKRFTELVAKLEEAQKLIAEKEAKLQAYDDAEAERMGQEVIDDLKPEKKRTIAKRAKKLANQIRAGKIHKPGSLYSVTPVTAAWDAALEVTALAIDNGGKLIEAVQKGIDIIREWKMSQADKDETVLKFKEYMKQFSPIGNVTVLDDSARAGMNKMVREKVEDGLETINEVVDAIYEEIKDQIPGLTWRELRDFISGYGKFKKLSSDEVSKKIREIKRDGRDDAALEDVNNYVLPARTGIQRDKPTPEQRRKRAEILKGIKEKGLEPPMTEDEMEAQWRTSEDAYISRLENAIEDIQNEISSGKLRDKPEGRVFDSPEVKRLQAEKERLIGIRDALLGTRRANLTTDQKIEMAKKATERAIDKIQQGITNLENGLTEEGDIYPERRKNDKLHSAELDALRAQKELLTEQRDMLIPQEVRDTALINRVIKSRQRTLAALEDIQARKDYAKKEKAPAPETKEIIDLNRKIFNLKLEIDTEKEKVRLRNLSAWDKVANILGNMWNVSKALRATIDLSAPLRQGKFFIGKPGIWGRAFIDMFKYAKSKKYFENQMADLMNSEEYYQMRKHKLYLSTPNARLDAQEEVFMSDWLYYVKKYTWLYGKAIEASERAYTGFLNELRIGVYRDYSEMIKKEIANGSDLDYDAEMESYASIINNGTGRASLGFVEGTAPLLNGVFWAPRNAISRWNLSPFTPVGWYFYAQRSPRARKELLKDQFKFLGVVLSTLALVKMAWGCKDECDECDDCVKIELDSTSSDFLKIQLGKLRFDLLAGFQQVARTTSQMWYGQKKSAKTGEVQFLPSNEYKSDTRLTVGMEFVRSKLSPSSSLVVSALDGMKTSMGEPLTIGTAAQSLAEPLSIEQVYEIAREEGLGTSAISLVSLFGEGVQYFKEETPEEKAAKKKATKLENKEIKLKERQLND